VTRSQRSHRSRYDLIARGYAGLLRLGSAGRIDRLYEAAAGALGPLPGGTLVELGCGPASATPHRLPKVGPSGALVGVDLAEGMVAEARRKAARLGWRNARFECGDALDYSPPSPVDAIVFSLSLSTMPDAESALEHALSILAPGGQLVVLDSIPEPGRPLARAIIHLKAPLVGARPTRAPLDFAFARLEEVRVQRLFLGAYTVVSGRKPAKAADRKEEEEELAQNPTVVVTFKDIEPDESVREAIATRTQQLREEFHELLRVEVTLLEDGGAGFSAHGHASGKGEDVGAQATAKQLLPAAEALLDKLERQLRKHHDKRIFTQRREAQRDAMRKKTS
jgi:ribosomal subunit interface protein